MIDFSMLYDFQREVVLKASPSHVYAADTGTGKTMMAIHHYIMHSNGEPLLIVQPPAKLKEGGWSREIQRVCDYYRIAIQYEELSVGMLAKRWESFKKWFVIFDEAHLTKNATSQRGKAALGLVRSSTNFLLLSATMMSNGWLDFTNVALMFNFYKNKTQFLREHAQYESKFFGGKQVKVISGWRDEEKLKQLYQSISTKLSKDECLDLPPLVFEDVHFKPSKEYEVIRKKRVLETENETIAYDTVMKLQHGLRFYANQKDKLSYTEMLAESTTENIVIFYYYQAEKEELIKMLSKTKTIYEVSGKVNHLPSRDIWNDLNDTVTLVQYQAGAAGIELQYANLVVFYTPTFSLQDYEQSLGRAYRNGQTKKVTAYRYITQRSVEERVYAALSEKKDFTDQLFKEYIGGA